MSTKQDKRTNWFLSLSDIHHGAKPAEEMLNEFYSENENGFFTTLNESVLEEEFLGVFLTGDYFDCKLDMNDSKSKVATGIFLEIYETCRKYNKYFVVLRGTYSHDFSQLDHFVSLSSYNKFFLVNTVEELDIDGLKVLVIPEEYMEDQDEFYKPFLKKKYDIILGHGLFKYNAFEPNASERPMSTMPLFDENQLMKMAPLIIFGHVHTHSNFKNNIYYNGSFSRLCHGEEDPKGFLIVFYEPADTKNHEVTLLENELAPIYKTLKIENIIKPKDTSLELFIKRIEKVKESCNFLKIKISKTFTEKYSVEVEAIKNYFYSIKSITIEGANLSFKTNEDITEFAKEDLTEAEHAEKNKYSFLNDNMPLAEKVLTFIATKHEQFDCDITQDLILEAFSTSEDEM